MKKNNSEIMTERILYNPENTTQMIDWMGYEIGDDNDISHDHDENIPTTAVVTETGNKKLSQLKMKDRELYENWLDLFQMMDRIVMEKVPDESIWCCIKELNVLTESIFEDQDDRRSVKR